MLHESRVAAAAVSMAILFDPSAAVAATSAPVAASQPSQISWQTLSMLSPEAAVGFAGAQATDAAVPPPPVGAVPPPPPAPDYDGVGTPPLPVIGIWLATIAVAVYILTKNHHGHGQFGFQAPNSPA